MEAEGEEVTEVEGEEVMEAGLEMSLCPLLDQSQ